MHNLAHSRRLMIVLTFAIVLVAVVVLTGCGHNGGGY